jgi:hypothetical protein
VDRVLDGLEGVAQPGGKGLDRSETRRLLAGLHERCFLLRDVHEDAPVLFQTRWALSYLRGPLTSVEISRLCAQGSSSSVRDASLLGAGVSGAAEVCGGAASIRHPSRSGDVRSGVIKTGGRLILK